MVIVRKKLIEVALPLEAINEEGSRRKRKAPAGYPTTLHKWWAQRPVAAARAVIFAQTVDDPSTYVNTLLHAAETRRAAEREQKKRHALWETRKATFAAATGAEAIAVPEPGPEPTLEDCAADIERQRLFRIIEELVLWENTTNDAVLERARAEIWQSWRRACADNAGHPRAAELFNRNKLPAFHDPFAGSGALPLEAQRLGLEVYASDLNPVAVLINKAMIEIPPRFVGRTPTNQAAREEAKHGQLRGWRGAQGLAEDVRHYGEWVRDEAERRIGHLYPKIGVTAEMAAERPDLKPYLGRNLTVIAWLWARTVNSPNPAFSGVGVPLASTFMLSTKAGKEAYVQPVIENDGYRFTVRVGRPMDAEAAKVGTKLARGAHFKCLMSGGPIDGDYIKAEGRAGRMGARLMAIVAEGDRGRVYFSPTPGHEDIALQAKPEWRPDTPLAGDLRALWTPPYGLSTFGDLFTRRQLVALNTFSDLVMEAREKVKADSIIAGLQDDGKPLAGDGIGAQAYSDAVAIYLAFAVSRCADYGSSIATWRPKDNAMRSSMPKQGIQMSWDFAEGAPFGASSSGFFECIDVIAKVLETSLTGVTRGQADQQSAQGIGPHRASKRIYSTDPPYYDNVGYADLSDFLYVWLRRSLKDVFPNLFSTLVTPKNEELVATPYRHGGRDEAEKFFLSGMTDAMHHLSTSTHPAYPVSIYYAYKQSEKKEDRQEARTGWETFLGAVVNAGFAVSGTWPVRTESDNRQVGIGANALASSIVLVCRPRAEDAPAATRREFLNALKAELPEALRQLQRGNIAPVDLAQASIGPGMAVFTRFGKVVDAEGKTLSVGEALALINEVLDEVLAEQEGDFDADSRFAIAWFEQFGFAEGEFGVADVLARAKVTSVAAMADPRNGGILQSKAGKVRLLKPDELPEGWEPATDPRLTVWEMAHHLIRVLEAHGEAAAGGLAAKLGVKAEIARELAYRLYTVCERRKRAAEALSYNGLVQSWPEITRLAREGSKIQAEEPDMFAQA
ncbi:putative DNA methylase [Rhizobiales bacterium GAS113]|nr:putative DNA methylase [Rhizobiales bacterium GAS113]